MFQAPRVPLAPLSVLALAAFVCLMGSLPAAAVAGPPTATTEAVYGVRYEEATLNGKVNPEGLATTYWFEYGKTTSYGTKIPASPVSVGSGASNVEVSQTVTGLSQSTEYHFRVVAENDAKETANGEDATFKTTGFDFDFGEEGSENGQFEQPYLGIAVDVEGNIWVADTENNRIQKFNSKGEYLAKCGKQGTGNGEFEGPKGLALDPSGNIWVVDSGNDRVQKFNSKCEFLLKFGETGSGEGQFDSPAGMAFSGTNAFVVDSDNNRVQKFNLTSTPKFLAQFGKEGSGDGDLKSPTGVVVESSGIWVADTGNNRVQKFNAINFKFGQKFGEKGSGEGQFESPTGITSDFQDRLWVVDSGNNRAQKFNLKGVWQDTIGEEGSGPGQLENPTGIATPAPQKVLILDTGNNRAQSWRVKAEPPDVITRPATELKASSAMLQANIDPEALAASYWFEYDTAEYKTGEGPHGIKIPVSPESIGSGSTPVKVSQTISGLSKSTQYHFRAVGRSSAGVELGVDQDFELFPPKVTAEAATLVKATEATLNGKVNPRGSLTSYWFEYGAENVNEMKIPASAVGIGMGNFNVTVKQTPTGLKEGTTYKFRLVAESYVDTIYGEVKTFTTLKSPKATTEAATSVGLTEATLNGKVNPKGLATTYWFEYGETESYGTKIPVSPESVGSGTEDVEVSKTPTGLQEGVTYHFRVVAESEAVLSPVLGADEVFKTSGPPKATTEAATSVKATEATLNGKVNPKGLATTYWFEYGETESYGTKIPVSPASVGSGTADVAVSQTPTGLKEETTYHFRVVAENEKGEVPGNDRVFKTHLPPKATTEAATSVKATEATLNGKVNPKGLATTYWFEYDTTEYKTGEGPHGTKIPVSPKPAGSGTEDVAVNQTPTGLSEETTYHFRVVAESEAGKVLGGDKTLKTLKVPKATTEAATLVKATEATLNGKVNPEGLATTYWFEYGETESYGTKIPVSPESVGSGTEDVEVSKTPTGLKEGVTYHFRVVAESEAGSRKGADRKFTTSSGLLLELGLKGASDGHFISPYGIATDTEGNVWVADTGNSRIQRFSSNNAYLGQFGVEGEGEGQLLYPYGVAVDAEGNVWVADLGNDRVQKYDPEGEYLDEFGSEGSGDGQLLSPFGIAIDSEGDIWVVDTGNSRVQEFNSEGEYLTKCGSEGSGDGQLSEPTGIAIDSEDDIWVVDTGNDRVQQLSPGCEYLSKLGTAGEEDGQFLTPRGVAIDSEGQVWVTDTENNRVQGFDSEGEFIEKFGPEGFGKSQLSEPTGIAIDSEDNAWVVDTGNTRFLKWVP